MTGKRSPAVRAARHGLGLLLLILLGCAAAGCSTQRTLQIDTDPTGARIWVNGVLQPTPTPVDVAFTHYGRTDVRVEKDGYESVATELNVPSELDGYPVIDLLLEMLRPRQVVKRVVPLKPLSAEPTEADALAALQRARGLRERTRREVIEPGTPGRAAPAVLRP